MRAGTKGDREIKPTLTDNDLASLLRAAEGTSFEARRDTAILRLLIDSGVGVSGLGGMLPEDVDLPAKTIKVVLKEGEEHLIPHAPIAVAGNTVLVPAGGPANPGGATGNPRLITYTVP